MTPIKLTGIDPKRPPHIRKEAYIDIYYQLSEKPPAAWCDLFDNLGRKIEPAVKVDKTTGDCIGAWVRDMEGIPGHFNQIKQKIAEANVQFEDMVLQQAARDSAAKAGSQGSAQTRLNEILSALDFE